MCRLAVILIVALAAAFAAGCASISPTVPVVHDAVYPATGLTTIQLENQNGAVNVTGWERDQIQVRVVNGRGVEKILVESAGETMTVRTVTSPSANPLGAGAQYEIHVPRSLARIEARTSNGGVRITDCNGTVDATTSNGGIHLTGTRAIDRLETSNGGIDAEIRALDADARVSTSNGAVGLRLGPSLNAEIEARTSNSRISVQGLSLNTTVSGPSEVQGTIGAGGPRLVVETSNGAITLSAL